MKEIDIEIKYEEIALFEEKLGGYKTKKMILDVGGEKVELRPIGTILIAAKGRIDIEGPKGKVRILLVPQDADGPMISGMIVIPEAKLKKELEEIEKKEQKSQELKEFLEYFK